VAVLNDLVTTLGKDSGKDVIRSVFDRITDYTIYHFQTEETYFDEFHYEGATEHKAKHAEFKEKFAQIQTDYLTNQVESTFNLVDFLENWLLDHLMNMDKKYVVCFKEHGL
jgi:hemerythrin-like metal-binding protein